MFKRQPFKDREVSESNIRLFSLKKHYPLLKSIVISSNLKASLTL